MLTYWIDVLLIIKSWSGENKKKSNVQVESCVEIRFLTWLINSLRYDKSDYISKHF